MDALLAKTMNVRVRDPFRRIRTVGDLVCWLLGHRLPLRVDGPTPIRRSTRFVCDRCERVLLAQPSL